MRESRSLLSQREGQILNEIAAGKTTKEIAALLGLSPWTVADHRKSLCRKLGARSTAELIRFGIGRHYELTEKRTTMLRNETPPR